MIMHLTQTHVISPTKDGWVSNTLYRFTNGVDGSGPLAGLILDSGDNLYGTTPAGGTCGAGTIFELRHNGRGWSERTLHSFCDGGEGGAPGYGSLTFDSAGTLYGTTRSGGNGAGVAFSLRKIKGAWKYSVVHAFTNYEGGTTSGLTLDMAGNLYGAADLGGGAMGLGTIFRLSHGKHGWTCTVLDPFSGGDYGQTPIGHVVLDKRGNLYGTTYNGGPPGVGTVFKLTPAKNGPWHRTLLHGFTGGDDGYEPFGGIVWDTAGRHLYGTTTKGGRGNQYCDTFGCGVVYEITP